MKWTRLGSAAIAAVRYDEKKRTLDVEFRDGDTYRYAHVPEFVYRELLKAESAGAFWNHIKDQFEYVKVAERPSKSATAGSRRQQAGGLCSPTDSIAPAHSPFGLSVYPPASQHGVFSARVGVPKSKMPDEINSPGT